MNELWISLREYAILIGKSWWQLAIAFAGGSFAVVSAFKSGLVVPYWVGIAVALAALFRAQFVAFHRVRLARDRAGPRLLARLGGANEFSGGNYWPHDRAGYVEAPGHGLAVRAIVGPPAHDPHARITKTLRESLPALLAESDFEMWLRSRAAVENWGLTMPMGPFFASAARGSAAAHDEHGTYSAYASFQLPTTPQSPRAFIAVDLVFAPSPDPPAASKLSLADVQALCLSLLSTAVDRLAPRLLPAVVPSRHFGRRRGLTMAGPSIFFYAPSGRTLADYVDLTALQLVQGATLANVNQVAAIELPSGHQLKTLAERDRFVRAGLKTILDTSCFLDGDSHVDALPRPNSGPVAAEP